MCIASIVKLNHQTLITFTRDESMTREFEMPAMHSGKLFYPKDLHGHGTWIGHNFESVYFLQNGAKTKHIRTTPYSISRGQLLLEALKGKALETLCDGFENEHVEPFTLSEFNLKTSTLKRMVYDGHRTEIETFQSLEKYVYLSSTLYNEEMKDKISRTFQATDFHSNNDLLEFHLKHCIGCQDGLHLTQVGSSSLTQFIISNKEMNVIFINRLTSESKDYRFEL